MELGLALRALLQLLSSEEVVLGAVLAEVVEAAVQRLLEQ
jgi:hypothetical protein